jgi:hypothetical protein
MQISFAVRTGFALSGWWPSPEVPPGDGLFYTLGDVYFRCVQSHTFAPRALRGGERRQRTPAGLRETPATSRMTTVYKRRSLSRAAGSAAVATLLASMVPDALTSQTRGTVLDPLERPVANAIVELWEGSRLAAGAESDREGHFEIGAAPAGALSLTVRRLGFRTRTMELTRADTVVVVTMETQPLVLDELSVFVAPRRLCPNREDPRARTLWEEMRSRYWQLSMDSVFVHGFMEIRSGTGEEGDAFRPEAGRTRSGWTTGALVSAHPELMLRSGYASRADGGPGERTAFWYYRALDHGAMQDFAGSYFGSAHTLSIVSAADPAVIAFCPRARTAELGQIEGTLHLRPDGTLRMARWQFVTPRPDEDAGGEASYYAPNDRLGAALLAQETFFWRRSGSRRYYFEGRTFTGWRRWHRDAAVEASAGAASAHRPRDEP